MTKTPQLALLQTMTLPGDSIAEWVHLLPAGEITTQDGRGPYRVGDASALITASLHQGAKLPIDENHAIDLAAPRGEASPARGYIVELQAREDGLWGRVEWTESGKALMADRAYLGLSPAIIHDAKGQILRILRASLVNRPNLRGLTALHHQEDPMSLLQRLAALLGLEATATEDALIERVTSLHQQAPQAVALQSQLSEIGTALGVSQNATAETILGAARQKAAGGNEAIVALQAELTTVTGQLNAIREDAARGRAETFVDGEIKRGRVGVKPLRDHYIAMHMADPARVEKELGALPILNGSGTVAPSPPRNADGELALNAEQMQVARLLGQDPKAYALTLKAEREETL